MRVTLHVWGITAARVPQALARMAAGTRSTARRPGVSFVKQLGTGDDGFTLRGADPRHWALLTVWRDEESAKTADDLPAVRAWDRFAQERWRADLQPLASRGRWARREPFGAPEAVKHAGPVAAITRARLVPRKALSFYRAVPPVAQGLREAPGLQVAFGVGEAPIGLQGTFSLWDDAASLRAYAYQGVAHQRAIAQTAELGWYGEELFARFAVLRAHGTLHGRPLDLEP
jgi:hypothetical protein